MPRHPHAVIHYVRQIVVGHNFAPCGADVDTTFLDPAYYLTETAADVSCPDCKAKLAQQQKPVKRSWNVCVVDGHASPISTWFTNADKAEVLRWVKSLSGSLSGRHVTSASFVAIYAPEERRPDLSIDATFEEMQFTTLPAVQERTTVGECWAELTSLQLDAKSERQE